jgi:hypothetical protein
MNPADQRVLELVDQWLKSLELHLKYTALTDEAYWQVQPWVRHQRPARWILDLAQSRALELKRHLESRAASGDAGFAEALELMAFLANLVGVQNIERFIPLAEPERENAEALGGTHSTLQPLTSSGSTTTRALIEPTREMLMAVAAPAPPAPAAAPALPAEVLGVVAPPAQPVRPAKPAPPPAASAAAAVAPARPSAKRDARTAAGKQPKPPAGFAGRTGQHRVTDRCGRGAPDQMGARVARARRGHRPHRRPPGRRRGPQVPAHAQGRDRAARPRVMRVAPAWQLRAAWIRSSHREPAVAHV